jgi:hypothetical protein
MVIDRSVMQEHFGRSGALARLLSFSTTKANTVEKCVGWP